MRYRLHGNNLALLKFMVTWCEEESDQTNISQLAADAEECDAIVKLHPGATVQTVDNTGYDWLDGMTFTNDQVLSGEVERAAEMGEAAYMEYRIASDRDAQILDLDFRLSLLELGITEGGENV